LFPFAENTSVLSFSNFTLSPFHSYSWSFRRVRLSVTPWTVACQAPLSMGFSRQGYWSGLPFPTLGDLPDQRSNSRLSFLLHWQVDSLPLHHLGSPEAWLHSYSYHIYVCLLNTLCCSPVSFLVLFYIQVIKFYNLFLG